MMRDWLRIHVLRRCPCGARAERAYLYRWCDGCGPYVGEEQ